MNVQLRNGFLTRGAAFVLPQVSAVVQTLILHIAISVSLHGFASADGGHGHADHDPPRHVLVFLPRKWLGSQFMRRVTRQGVC